MNNTIILENCLRDFKNKNNIEDMNNTDAFEMFSILTLTKDRNLSFSEVEESIVGGGQDGGIDSFLVLVNEHPVTTSEDIEDFEFNRNTRVNILITQAKFKTAFEESVIDKLHISIPVALNLELGEDALLRRFNPKLVEKIMLFRKTWLDSVSRGGKLSITFYYACKANEIDINESFKSKIEQLTNITISKTNQEEVIFKNCSAREILEVYQKPESTLLELKFKENPTPVSFKDIEYGYIGVISLDDYYKFIMTDNLKINESIFDSNVRHFQGNIDVNKRITETLRSDLSSDFWWLNNGITIIASECNQVSKCLHLTDVQIVNGLQTSFLIAEHYQKEEDEKRSILVKVIITKDKETIDKIIRASNSQTPISPSVLRATDEVQRQIELFFSGHGYWYDRRKNFYKNLGKPARRIFSIQETAQSIEAIIHFNPANARSTPTGIVKSDKSYDRIFNPNLNFMAYLNSCIINRQVNEFIKNKLSTDKKPKARNFSYHTARILASVITEKVNYDASEISKINPENMINENHVNHAFELLESSLEAYIIQNPEENIINIAKSRKFANELNQYIAQSYA